MNKNLNYIIYIFFISLLLFWIINIYSGLNENFKNNCNKFFKNKSFCQYDVNKSRCECYFQKDSINKPFKAPETCCDNKCINLSKEDCNQNKKLFKLNYYCNISGKCKKFKGTSLNSRVSENNCGLSNLTDSLILPYENEEECESDNNECNKYNRIDESVAYNRSKCLKNSNCGYCTNEYNRGLCIEGNSDGPLDKLKYGDFCKVGKNYDYTKKIEYFSNQDKYCNINGTCTKMKGDNCGTNKLNGQFNEIFDSKEECVKKSLVCDKYNDKSKTNKENKENCLNNVNCGYCKNNNQCVIGTAEGPNNGSLNYDCISNTTYEYGNHATYII